MLPLYFGSEIISEGIREKQHFEKIRTKSARNRNQSSVPIAELSKVQSTVYLLLTN